MKKFYYKFMPVIAGLFIIVMLAGCTGTGVDDKVSGNIVSQTEPITEQNNPKPEITTSPEIEDVDKEPAIPIEVRTDVIASSEGEDGKLVFRFLNDKKTLAKWGDSCFIRFPNGETMLVDAGIPDTGKLIVKYLELFGVEKIDHLVVTHNHVDHIGGIPEIIEHFEVTNLYSTVYGKWASKYEQAASKITGKRYYLTRGDSFDIGEVRIDVLSPSFDTDVYRQLREADMPKREKTILTNLNSLAMKLTYGKSTALFAADIYADTERELVEEYGDALKSDLLKIPHHGQSSSSTKEFVNAVSPKVAVATGGETLTLFNYSFYDQVGTDVYQSYYDGCVKVVMDNTGNPEVTTEMDRTEAYIYQ